MQQHRMCCISEARGASRRQATHLLQFVGLTQEDFFWLAFALYQKPIAQTNVNRRNLPGSSLSRAFDPTRRVCLSSKTSCCCIVDTWSAAAPSNHELVNNTDGLRRAFFHHNVADTLLRRPDRVDASQQIECRLFPGYTIDNAGGLPFEVRTAALPPSVCCIKSGRLVAEPLAIADDDWAMCRIFYWPGARFDASLLVQSLIMVAVQTVLLKTALDHRPLPATKGGEGSVPFSGLDRDGALSIQRPYNFWQWRSHKPYVSISTHPLDSRPRQMADRISRKDTGSF